MPAIDGILGLRGAWLGTPLPFGEDVFPAGLAMLARGSLPFLWMDAASLGQWPGKW